jgi:hypothetical protein
MSGERGFEDFSVPPYYWHDLVEMGVIPKPKPVYRRFPRLRAYSLFGWWARVARRYFGA